MYIRGDDKMRICNYWLCYLVLESVWLPVIMIFQHGISHGG
ncbi:LOW QUALITY PROTEIN: hypothetical protein PanWU01x14_002360 [Parasponia andersonii]|uniref:Uncharacterized protein n=1 Tax=Parasponia andersonii TaxID=3476 RepID=A0A2P5E5A9_PARAD|nr:LOW QUALITY PROTEIN: hypothetical protein PanWU01x14_002360 [Parasponia andersonii]